MKKVLFYEKQHWSKNVLLVVLPITVLASSLFAGYLFIRLNYTGNPLEIETFSKWNFVVMGIILSTIVLIVTISKSIRILKTKIYQNKIIISYSSINMKQLIVDRHEIHSYQIETYRAYRNYFGYGKKNNSAQGKAFTVSGKYGLKLYLKDGEKILIGTQKKQAIKYAMEKLMNRKS